jgi:hypothetical protein
MDKYDEKFIGANLNKVDWNFISRYKFLSENFIEKATEIPL